MTSGRYARIAMQMASIDCTIARTTRVSYMTREVNTDTLMVRGALNRVEAAFPYTCSMCQWP